MKRLITIIMCFALVTGLCSCSLQAENKFSKTTFELFDTVITVTAYDESEAKFEEHFRSFYNELEKYHRLYDIYHIYDPTVNLKTLNDSAYKKPVKVDEKLMALLKYGKEVYKLSGGRVNICLGSVLSIWHTYREKNNNTLPPKKELEDAAKHTDINDMLLDEKKGTVFFKDKALKLDAGAIAKGFAGERIKEFIKSNGLWQNALINLGGNIIAIGSKQDGEGWNIGIENPRDIGNNIKTLSVHDKCVVTSGDYQRYYEVDGKRYCHIIDPQTLMPAGYHASVSVVCDSSAQADALSTMLFLMPTDEALSFVNSEDGIEAAFIEEDESIILSDNFEGI